MKVREIGFSDVFDDVQLLSVAKTSETKVKLVFFWSKSFAERLKKDALKEEKAQKRLEVEMEAKAKVKAKRDAMAQHVRQMIEEKKRGE